ncbi:MAG: hypothetical protein O2954_20790, partial [bacterium]|nr:hypothetical protein [bacterium]
YYQYDDGFFADPTISLDRATSGSDSHQYGASIYAHYLEQVYGRDSIRRSWEQLGKSTARRYDVQEFNASMPTGGYAGVMPGFAVWNYFTGTRHRAGFYEEGAQYNTMKATTVALSSSGATGSGRMDHLGAEYLRVATSSLSPGTGLRAAFTLGTGGVWDLIVLLVKSDRIEMLRPSGAQVEIGNVSQYTEIVFIPIAKALSGSRFTYSYTITPITSTDGQTRPLALAINGTGVPVVVMDQAVSTAKVVAAGAGAGESLTWSVVRTSGDLAVSVSGQTNLSSFQTTSSSIDLVAAGNGWATVEIAVRGAGSTVSLISAVFNQPPPQNLPPVFTPITTRTVNEGAQLSFVVEATDSDGDALTYSVTSMPEGAQFTGQTFRWTPGSTQGGSAYEVVFVASDGTEQTSMTVRIEVADVNQPVSIQKISPERPVVVGGMGDTLRFSVTAVDPDHDPVNYSWTFNEISLAENGSSVLVTVSVGETDDTVQVAVSSGSVELVQRWTIGKALKGDFNGDGRVSFGDFVLFAGAYGKTLNTPGFEATYDLNSNETVDFSDFVIFVQYYGLP